MNGKEPGLIVLMPTRGTIAIETMLCLRHRLDYPHKLYTAIRKDVVTARNQLAIIAREAEATLLGFDPEFVLTTDDDMWWPNGRVRECVTILQEKPDVDMVAGIYTLRQAGVAPCLYIYDCKTPDEWSMIPHKPDKTGHLTCFDRTYNPYEYADGELTKLALAEPGWAVMRRSLFDRVGPDPFNRIRFSDVPISGETDDLNAHLSDAESFSARVNLAGGKIVTRGDLIIGHVDTGLGVMYFPEVAPRYAEGLLVPTREAPSVDGEWRSYYASQGKDAWKPRYLQKKLDHVEALRATMSQKEAVA